MIFIFAVKRSSGEKVVFVFCVWWILLLGARTLQYTFILRKLSSKNAVVVTVNVLILTVYVGWSKNIHNSIEILPDNPAA